MSKDVQITEQYSHGNTGTATTWMGFGSWLDDKRKEANLTTRELAKRTGVSQNTVMRWLKGGLPTVSKYYDLQLALGNQIESIGFQPKKREGESATSRTQKER